MMRKKVSDMVSKALLVFMFLGLGMMGFMISQFIIVLAKPVTLNINGQVFSGDKPYYGDLTDLQILGERFARNHKYNLSYFNCVNYTDDYVRIASELGFNVKKVEGCKESNVTDCHAWIETTIDYEPQTGSYQDYSKLYPLKKS
jgi:hypothetical protein